MYQQLTILLVVHSIRIEMEVLFFEGQLSTQVLLVRPLVYAKQMLMLSLSEVGKNCVIRL